MLIFKWVFFYCHVSFHASSAVRRRHQMRLARARNLRELEARSFFLEGSFNATHFFFWEIKVDAKNMQWNIFRDFSKKSRWVDVIFHETPDYKFTAWNWLVFWTVCDQESLGYSDKNDILYKNEITENFSNIIFQRQHRYLTNFSIFSQRNHLGKGYALKKRFFVARGAPCLFRVSWPQMVAFDGVHRWVLGDKPTGTGTVGLIFLWIA